jgi:hypothetical protein
MWKMTVVGGFLTLTLAAARVDAQIVDAQTQINLRDNVLPGAIYGMSGSGLPPIVALEGPGSEIGASVRTLRPDETVAEGRGVVVESVATDGPALRAGLKPGDIILFYTWGVYIDDTRAFARLVRDTPPGRMLPAAIVRDGKRIEISLIPEPARAGSSEQPEH